MGVVFFPSLPFMGVMLFPSFVLGNASAEGSAPLAPLSHFSFSLPLSPLSLLLSFLLPFHVSFSLNSFHPFSSSFPLLSFLSSFHYVFLLCPFLLPSSAFSFFWSSSIYFHLVFLSFSPFFFLVELLVLNVFQDVIEGIIDCN